MNVRIANAWHGEAAFQVHDICLIADQRLNIVVRADLDELAVLDRHGFSPRLLFIDRVDLAIRVNRVGDLSTRRGTHREQDNQ